MSGYYTIFESEKSHQWYFNLKAGNHETILSSQGYTTRASAENGVASVQKHCADDSAFERKQSDAGFWFVLNAGNGQVIGKSEMYSSAAACEKGVASVHRNGGSEQLKMR